MGKVGGYTVSYSLIMKQQYRQPLYNNSYSGDIYADILFLRSISAFSLVFRLY